VKLAAVLVTMYALTFAAAGGRGAPTVRGSCSASALPGGPHDAEAVLAAFRRQMPSLNKGLVPQLIRSRSGRKRSTVRPATTLAPTRRASSR
jgi:hypothetical protein